MFSVQARPQDPTHIKSFYQTHDFYGNFKLFSHSNQLATLYNYNNKKE